MINDQQFQQVIPHPLMMSSLEQNDNSVPTPYEINEPISATISTVSYFKSILFELDMIKKNRIMSNIKYKNNKYRNKNFTFYQIWFPPENVPIQAKIFLLHEVQEHMERWESIAIQMAEKGYVVYAIDYYNHGRSSCDVKGYIDHWKLLELQAKLFLENEILVHADLNSTVEQEDQESDTSSSSDVPEIQQWKTWKMNTLRQMRPFISVTTEEWENKKEALQQHSYPVVLCGYGFGATLCLLLSLHYQQTIHSTILLTPYIFIPSTFSTISSTSSLLSQQQLIQTMNYFIPMKEMVSMDATSLTHDPQQQKLYNKDLLICKTKLRCNTLYQLLDASKRISQLLVDIKIWYPHVLLLHGAKDSYSTVDASRYITNLLTDKNSNSFTLQIYEDMFHDLLHESNSNRVVEDLLQWIQKHIYFRK